MRKCSEYPLSKFQSMAGAVALAGLLVLQGQGVLMGQSLAQAPEKSPAPQPSPHSTPPSGPPQSKSPSKQPDGKLSEAEKGAKDRAKPDRSALPRPSAIKTMAQKTKVLADLHERLVAAENTEAAEVVADTIEQMWLYSGSDTANLLMERALNSLHGKKPEMALQLLGGVIKLQPNYAEAWNRRAYVHFAQKDYRSALIDLQRVLALEPRHFKAINGLATILREFGEKRSALKAYRMLLDVHPFSTDAQTAVKELEREVEGESL
jgi:tetratricopeptide (TPR) repeat protein